MTFFDVRVFDSNAKLYPEVSKDITSTTKNKKNARVLQVKDGSFTHLIFSINGGMGMQASKCNLQIAEMLSVKRDKSYSLIMSWCQRQVSFS